MVRSKAVRKQATKGAVSQGQFRRVLWGRKLTLTSNPSLITYSPWYNLVVASSSQTAATAGTMTFVNSRSVSVALLKQLGIAELTKGLAMRFQVVKAWIPQRDAMKPINMAMEVYGLERSVTSTSAVTAPLRYRGEDFATGINSARVGYEWPVVDQNVVVSTNDEPVDLIGIKTNISNAYVILHFHVLWQTLSADAIPSSGQSVQMGLECTRLAPCSSQT